MTHLGEPDYVLPTSTASQYVPERGSGDPIDGRARWGGCHHRFDDPGVASTQLTGPQYQASEHIPGDRLKAIQQWAHDLARDPKFDAQYLVAYTRSINMDTSLLNDVLNNTRALDAGEVGDLTIRATHIMDQVNDKIPKNMVDQKFIQQVTNARIKYNDIVSKVKYIARAIEDALRKYESLQSAIAEVHGKLQEKYDLMFQAIVLNKLLAENEDKQTDLLVSRTAELECLLVAIPDYITELKGQLKDAGANADEINANITRLNGFLPLVTKALSMLKPMIFTGNNAVQRYLNLSNMAGGRALVLGLFLSVGMYRWESDIVTQLQEMEQLAVGLAGIEYGSHYEPAGADVVGGFRRRCAGLRQPVQPLDDHRRHASANRHRHQAGAENPGRRFCPDQGRIQQDFQRRSGCAQSGAEWAAAVQRRNGTHRPELDWPVVTLRHRFRARRHDRIMCELRS